VTALSASDLREALDFLGEAEAVTGPDPFPTELLDRFRELIRCEFAAYCELDRVEQQLLHYEGCANTRALDGAGVPDIDVYWCLREQHPSCWYQERTLDFSARKLSDFLTSRQLRRLEIYAEWFQPWGVEYELVAGLPAPLSHTKVFLFDSGRRDFSERDRILLDLLRPHLVALYRTARDRRLTIELMAAEETGTHFVVLGPGASIDFADAGARALLERYFEGEKNGRMPELVGAWLRRESTRVNGQGALLRPSRPLAVEGKPGRLLVRRVGWTLLILEEDVAVARLTRREREIIDHLAAGRSNLAIALTLSIAEGTVRKHLEHLYRKLGVTNRTEAVARFRQIRTG
jgi:DNA-binding CsgD family transcriptional regulator